MLIRPLYQRHIEQVLVTVGLSIAFVALVQGIWGPTLRPYPAPAVAARDDDDPRRAHPERPLRRDRHGRGGARCSSQLFLRRTRYGLIIRAGVENRAMVTALGIDVRKAFTLVFALGGVAAALAGVLSGVYFNTIDPTQGTSLLIFAFIVVVIGGLGSLGGSARRGRRRRPARSSTPTTTRRPGSATWRSSSCSGSCCSHARAALRGRSRT